jgi:hypothetical protein
MFQRKKVGRALSQTGEIFSGVGKWVPGSHQPERNRRSAFLFSAPEAGLSGQNPIMINEPKIRRFGCFVFSGINKAVPVFPQNFKIPVR